MDKKLHTPPKLEELAEKHRKVKHMLLCLMEKLNAPRIIKDKIGDELFKIYKEIK